MGKWLPIISIWLVLCLISFCQFGIDKSKARRGKWRIPEKTLLITAAVGGAIGAWVGMQVFRHKTQHARFKYGIPAIIIAQMLILAAILYFL